VSEKLKQLKLDLLLKELKLLDSEQKYVDEFNGYYSPIFMEELAKNGYVIEQPTENIQPIKKEPIEVNDNDQKLIKSTFRSVAKESHPDKTKNPYKNKLYEEAQIAYDNNDLLTLYKVAKKLNIDVEMNVNTISLLEKIINEKKQKLKSVEVSFLWLWTNSQSQEQKDELINQFLSKHNKK
jgi:hypothetical protein